jgi:NAD(P)-dependent dehydrogenase (short-subunit alcohol dehydrogenase family)
VQCRTALVTGASGAIGGAIAARLAGQGHRVALHCYGHRERAEDLAGSLDGSLVVQADIREEADVKRMLAEVREALGPVEILVNNAGVLSDAFVPLLKVDEWDRCVDTSLKGSFLCAKHALGEMAKRRWGRIVNMGSVAGLAGDVARAHYAAAKAGLIGLSRSIAREAGRAGVTVNTVCPGIIDTPLIGGMSDARRKELLARIPLARWGTPEEVAALVGFLASEDAGYITGATLSIDGGLRM